MARLLQQRGLAVVLVPNVDRLVQLLKRRNESLTADNFIDVDSQPIALALLRRIVLKSFAAATVEDGGLGALGLRQDTRDKVRLVGRSLFDRGVEVGVPVTDCLSLLLLRTAERILFGFALIGRFEYGAAAVRAYNLISLDDVGLLQSVR